MAAGEILETVLWLAGLAAVAGLLSVAGDWIISGVDEAFGRAMRDWPSEDEEQ